MCPKGHCFGITRLCRVMSSSDPKDRFVHPYLPLMIDSFSCTLFVSALELVYILPSKVKKYKKTSRATSALDTSVVLESVLI